ncbi:MAG: lamin tail domain-containing protein, partial [Tahibacter sp.]
MLRKYRAFIVGLTMLSAASGANAALVISQAYGGGGNAGTVYTNDFIEVFNTGFTAVSLNGMSVQYMAAAGTGSWTPTSLGNVMLQPGQYYLVQEAAGAGGTTALPTPDATGSIAMSGTTFKIALVSSTTALSGACPTVGVVDMLGVGPTANCFETAPTAVLTNTTAAIRKTNGCTDSGSNLADFNIAVPTPRNTGSTLNPCGGGGPALAINDVTLPEGNSGTTVFPFVVSLTVAAGVGGVTFDIATTDGTATAGSDYTDSGTIHALIPQGQTSYAFNVGVMGDTTLELPETFFVNVTNVVGANVGDNQGKGTIGNDEVVEIHDIQGAGTDSPYVGTAVATNNNIVTGKGPQGFTMQTPDARIDANINTSEGIYVFTSSAPTVNIGDLVNVSGNALEFSGLTEIGSAVITPVSSGNPLPTPVEFNTVVPSADPANPTCVTSGSNFECFEGMLVHIANGITTTGNQRFGSPATETFAEVFVTANGRRGVREPGLLFPLTTTAGNTAAGQWDGNPEMFEMDADYFGAVPVDTPISGGSQFNATGVIGYDFGDYELWPTQLTITNAATIPRPVRDSSGATDLRIGAFNMLRFCDTVNDSAPGADDCVSPTPTTGAGGTFAVKVARLSAYIKDVLKLPDVLGTEEVENITALDALAAKLSLDSGIPYVARLQEGNDIGGIDVGFLVRTDRVSITTVTQLGKAVTWNDPTGSPTALLNDRPPLLLEAKFIGAGLPGSDFAVMVVHPKARSCTDAPTGASCVQADVDRNRLKRLTQGEYHAQVIQNYQSTHVGVPFTVVGDFNAYQFTDGWADVVGAMQGTYDDTANLLDYPVGGAQVTPHLWNAVNSLPLNEQYSFLFTENFGAFQGFNTRDVPTQQVLDNALLNNAARAQFSGFDYGRADQDAPNEWERQCNLVPTPAPPACPNPA